MNNKALFLDLDHTLIEPESGGTFPQNKEDWKLKYENVIARIHSYKTRGYKLIIVTNQGGVEANFITEEDLLEKLHAVVTSLQKPKTKEDYIDVYYCPNMKSYDRKPLPGMAYKAAIEFELDLQNSIMVGDMPTDKEFAHRAGIGRFYWADEFFND